MYENIMLPPRYGRPKIWPRVGHADFASKQGPFTFDAIFRAVVVRLAPFHSEYAVLFYCV